MLHLIVLPKNRDLLLWHYFTYTSSLAMMFSGLCKSALWVRYAIYRGDTRGVLAKILLIGSMAMLWHGKAQAQYYKAELYRVEQGLPTNLTKSIVQDHHGFV